MATQIETQLASMTAEQKLDFLCVGMATVIEAFERFQPLLDKVEKAGKARTRVGTLYQLGREQ